MKKCSPALIIKEVPNVQSVVLPNDWFEKIALNKSVFESLYEWMLKDSLIPQENKESLHNRTYIGEKLHKKLLSFEKTRIRKQYRLKGQELETALSMSELNAGPRTEVGECRISGDVILVIPESNRKEIEDLSVKISKANREKELNKIKAKAAGANFFQWLVSQVERSDGIGDIAKEVSSDKNFPSTVEYYQELESYLDSMGACSAAIKCFKDAWLEYITQYPERIKSCVWCNECGQKFEVNQVVIAYNSYESEEIFILDDICYNKYLKFETLEKLPIENITYSDLEELIKKENLSTFYVDEIKERFRLWGILPLSNQ